MKTIITRTIHLNEEEIRKIILDKFVDVPIVGRPILELTCDVNHRDLPISAKIEFTTDQIEKDL